MYASGVSSGGVVKLNVNDAVMGPRAMMNGDCCPFTVQYTCSCRFSDTAHSPMSVTRFAGEVPPMYSWARQFATGTTFDTLIVGVLAAGWDSHVFPAILISRSCSALPDRSTDDTAAPG